VTGPTATLDRALAAASASVRLLAAVTPDNAAEERARLVVAARRGAPAVPSWRYAPPHDELRRTTAWLRDVRPHAALYLYNMQCLYTGEASRRDCWDGIWGLRFKGLSFR
jgi:hypothetical protein